MDIKNIQKEELDKKSNNELIKINNELCDVFEANKAELLRLFDDQNLIEDLNEYILDLLNKRMNNK